MFVLVPSVPPPPGRGLVPLLGLSGSAEKYITNKQTTDIRNTCPVCPDSVPCLGLSPSGLGISSGCLDVSASPRACEGAGGRERTAPPRSWREAPVGSRACQLELSLSVCSQNSF